MAKNPVSVHCISTIGEIKAALKTSHHSFPVLNKQEKFVGLMPRNFMITLARNLAFYVEDLDDQEKENVRKSISAASESINYSNSKTYTKVATKRDSQISLLTKNLERKQK